MWLHRHSATSSPHCGKKYRTVSVLCCTRSMIGSRVFEARGKLKDCTCLECLQLEAPSTKHQTSDGVRSLVGVSLRWFGTRTRQVMGHWNRSDRVTRYVMEALRSRGRIQAPQPTPFGRSSRRGIQCLSEPCSYTLSQTRCDVRTVLERVRATLFSSL